MDRFSLVILAAGEGKRMKSNHSKVCHKLLNEPMIKWVYDAGKGAGISDIVTVVGHRREEVMQALGNTVKFAMQEEQLGTGHAVLSAEKYIDESSRYVMVLPGDAPLILSETLKKCMEYHIKNSNCATIITSILDNGSSYGRIIRDENGEVLKIVEAKDAAKEELEVREINSGFYCFDKDELFRLLKELKPENSQGEYYLTDVIGLMKSGGKKVGAFVLDDPTQILGVNDRVQLYDAQKALQRRINEYHALSGVTIMDFDSTYIGKDVKIGKDTVIYPNTLIFGKTTIGEECAVGPNTVIEDCEIGDFVSVKMSNLIQSKIGNNTTVGPFAYLRPGSVIGSRCKVGDFVEIKNSTLGDGTKASHLTYIGDAKVGKNVNFGCGTVIVNYDGKKKYTTEICDDVFIGCNSNLISPVKINEGAYIAAGSTITDEVPKNNLAIARARQVNKANWVDRRKRD